MCVLTRSASRFCFMPSQSFTRNPFSVSPALSLTLCLCQSHDYGTGYLSQKGARKNGVETKKALTSLSEKSCAFHSMSIPPHYI